MTSQERSSAQDVLDYFLVATGRVITAGYRDEIDWCRNLSPLEYQTDDDFFREYVWCVLNAGMKEQIARKIFDRFMESRDLHAIGHPGKREAIRAAMHCHKQWFAILKSDPEKIEYLQSLPWIGKITKYHLARNIGIDCVKPDRHLVKLAEHFGFASPLEMCQKIKDELLCTFGDDTRLGVIDIILWRDCNLNGVPA